MQDRKGYIFLCANSTQQECFDRLLFGGKEEYRKKIPQVEIGDKLFLYNYQEGLLHGVFEATSGVQENIEPEAWKGKFPWQIKVAVVKKYKPLSRADLMDVILFKKFPPAILSIEQVVAMEKLFQAKKRLPFFEDTIPYTADDGHRVKSNGEVLIDNWLYKNKILHAYEKQLESTDGVPETMYCDFFIPDSGIYLEYWGLNDKNYKKRKQQKIDFYKKNNLHLIEVLPENLKNLDELLKPLIS